MRHRYLRAERAHGQDPRPDAGTDRRYRRRKRKRRHSLLPEESQVAFSPFGEFIAKDQRQRVRPLLELALFIERELDAHAVLDGEVVCFDSEGKPRFYELMFGRGDPAFVAFDVLALEGRSLRAGADRAQEDSPTAHPEALIVCSLRRLHRGARVRFLPPRLRTRPRGHLGEVERCAGPV
jgi:hypothetical protein